MMKRKFQQNKYCNETQMVASHKIVTPPTPNDKGGPWVFFFGGGEGTFLWGSGGGRI